MLNVGPSELVVIFLVALLVLGPNKLPEAARQVGRVAAELRRLSSGFQDEVRKGFEEPIREVRQTAATVRSAASGMAPSRASRPSPKSPTTASSFSRGHTRHSAS